MYRSCFVAVALALGITGCGIGRDSQSPSATFTASVSYQNAYRSALEQARLCLCGKDTYEVKSQLDAMGKSALVRVVAPFTANEVARVDIQAIDDTSSNIQVEMWGKSIWNESALRAMQDAILYGIASCTAYMPRAGVSGKQSGIVP